MGLAQVGPAHPGLGPACRAPLHLSLHALARPLTGSLIRLCSQPAVFWAATIGQALCWSLLPLLPITSFAGQQARTWAGMAKTGGWEENYICKQGRASVSKEVGGHCQSFWSSGPRAPLPGPRDLVMRMPDSDLSFLRAWFWYIAAQPNCCRLETGAAPGRDTLRWLGPWRWATVSRGCRHW